MWRKQFLIQQSKTLVCLYLATSRLLLRIYLRNNLTQLSLLLLVSVFQQLFNLVNIHRILVFQLTIISILPLYHSFNLLPQLLNLFISQLNQFFLINQLPFSNLLLNFSCLNIIFTSIKFILSFYKFLLRLIKLYFHLHNSHSWFTHISINNLSFTCFVS